MLKQAILIMYHDDYNLLTKLLKLLDYKYIDIYIHVDKKVKDFDFLEIKKLLKESKVYFTKRLDVRWGTFKQIECELELMKLASLKQYKYYHLISGVDMPIKNIEKIYNFFNEENHEFIGFTDFNNISDSNLERVKYYHLFNNNLRSSSEFKRKLSNKIYYNLLRIEKILKINRLKNKNLIIRKGPNWFSITDELVRYVISQEKLIKKVFRYSYCADEVFLQTLVYNSKFKDNVYRNYKLDNENAMRLIDWIRGEPYVFKEEDFELIKNSKMMFARKFSSQDIEIVEKIERLT